MGIALRRLNYRNEKPSLLIVDSQSVKNSDTGGGAGYDGGKKTKGIKRHVFVDVMGFPYSVGISPANVGDRAGALECLANDCGNKNLQGVKTVLADGGYTGDDFKSGVKSLLGNKVRVKIAKRNELHTFKVIPKRWIVERSFAWLGKSRRLSKNYERLFNTSKQFILLSFLSLALNRF